MENNELMNLKFNLIEGIKNGIEEDGVVRPFDLVDYLQLTKFELKRVMSHLANTIGLSSEERKIIIPFVKKYGEDKIAYISRKTYEESFMKARLAEKNIISGVEITEDMKKQTFMELTLKNVPITPKTYNAYIHRIIRNIKLAEEQNKKID